MLTTPSGEIGPTGHLGLFSLSLGRQPCDAYRGVELITIVTAFFFLFLFFLVKVKGLHMVCDMKYNIHNNY